MFIVYLGLGSNVGDRLTNLSHAVNDLEKYFNIKSVSSVYETEPWGVEEQERYLNIVVEIETNYYPMELFEKLQQIESKHGRKKHSHMQSRTLDIDVLLYKGWSFENSVISIPHPELERRRFVLEPISEIAPMAVHPILGKTMISLLRHCRDRNLVMRTAQKININKHSEK